MIKAIIVKRQFMFLAVVILACGSFSCMYGKSYYEPIPQRDATIQSPQEERVEEIESTEKRIPGPWHEK
jgi:hypothetical protein